MTTKPHVLFSVSAWCVAYSITHGGNSPSLREIADHFGVVHSAINHTMERMFRYGIAERIDGKLVIVGSQYVPPLWYVENVNPPLSPIDLTKHARRNSLIIPVTAGR